MLKEAQDYQERYQNELKFLKEIEKNFQFAKTQQVKSVFVIPILSNAFYVFHW